MTLLKAEAKIIRSKCRVGKLTRKASNAKKRNRVLAQAPKAGSVLPFRGKVRLVVGRGRRR